MVDEVWEPQWKILIFGDGCQARVVKQRPIRRSDGLEMIEFLIIPTKEMKIYLNIKDEDMDDRGLLCRRFSRSDVIPLNEDPLINTTLIIKDWDWEETVLSRKYPSTEELNSYQQMLEISRCEVALLREKLDLKVSQSGEARKKELKELEALRKALGQSHETTVDMIPAESDGGIQ